MNKKELDEVMQYFSLDVLDDLGPEDFIDFGRKNSHFYRTLFVRSVAHLSAQERTFVIALATLLKNKNRILRVIDRFVNKDWYAKVKVYFQQYTCQSTRHETQGIIAVFRIPFCFPPCTAFIWVKATKNNRTVSGFLQNQWAAQIALHNDLIAIQRAWEEGFWNERANKGWPNFRTNGFNPAIWEIKTQENWQLMGPNALSWPFKKGQTVYDEEDITNWLASFSAPPVGVPRGLQVAGGQPDKGQENHQVGDEAGQAAH